MSKDRVELRYYRRMWLLVSAVTMAGLGLTMALNVMHAPNTLAGHLIGGFPPVAVLGCLELISRIPQTSKLFSFVRIVSTIGVTAMAFWISYGQQRAYILDQGFEADHANIYPLIIDGAMVVAALSLVEVSRKVRELRSALLDREAKPASLPIVRVTPADVEREIAGRRFREAAAQPRPSASVPAVVNGSKPFELATTN
jgi:uncharacterized protein DUF2637